MKKLLCAVCVMALAAVIFVGCATKEDIAVIGGADGPTAVYIDEKAVDIEEQDIGIIGGADGPTAIVIDEKD